MADKLLLGILRSVYSIDNLGAYLLHLWICNKVPSTALSTQVGIVAHVHKWFISSLHSKGFMQSGTCWSQDFSYPLA